MLPILLRRSYRTTSVSLNPLHHSNPSAGIYSRFINHQSNVKGTSKDMRYISPTDLAAMMKNPSLTSGKDFLVVDVRDEDHVGGHIVGSINRPSTKFLASVDKLVKDAQEIPSVIFHCALSQVRGPKAARIYEETRNNTKYKGQATSQEIAVLRDGFVGFQSRYKDDPELVTKWDKDVWEPDLIPLPKNSQ